MIRPGLYIGYPFVLGLVLASAVSGQWFLAVGGIAFAAAAVLVWQKRLWKYVVLSTLSCLTACCVYWNADAAYARQLAFAGQETQFTGSVYRRTVYDSGFARYYLKGEFPDGTKARVELFLDGADYAYGETLNLTGTPEKPEHSALFDGASYAKAQRVSLTFGTDTVVTSHLPLEKPMLRSIVYNWREKMLGCIRARMGRETAEMLTGLLFGDRTGMSRENRTALNRTGLGHVLVVSGLHFDFLAVCAGLTVIVLMQEGKSAGLGSIGGIGDSYWGKNKGRSMEGTLVRFTKILAAAFLVLALLLNMIPDKSSSTAVQTTPVESEAPAETTAAGQTEGAADAVASTEAAVDTEASTKSAK